MNITLRRYASEWLENVRLTRKPATYVDYQAVCNTHIFPALGSRQLANISRQDIKSFIVTKTQESYSPATVHQIYRVLRALLGEAVEDDILDKNPAATIGKTRLLPTIVREDPDPFTAEEVSRLMVEAKRDKHSYPMYALYCLAYKAGLRKGELLALTPEDVDFTNRNIVVRRTVSAGQVVTPKSGKPRKVDMSDSLYEDLQEYAARRTKEVVRTHWRPESEFLFFDRHGRMLCPRTLGRRHEALCKKAGVKYRSLHNFRHTFVIHLLQRGATLPYVRDMCGHSSIQITADVYGRFATNGSRAVNLLDEQPGWEGLLG